MKWMVFKKNLWIYGVLLTSCFFNAATVAALPIDQKKSVVSHLRLIEKAIAMDPQRQEILAQTEVVRVTGQRNAFLKDPKLKFGVGGLPTDTFQWNTDPMTNLSVGFMQQFESGDSLSLMRLQGEQQTVASLKQLSVRARDVANNVTQLGLELRYQQQAHQLLTKKLKLMQENEQALIARYAFGGEDSPSVLGAQIAITQLEEKRENSVQQQTRLLSLMSEWLGTDWLNRTDPTLVIEPVDWTKLEKRLDWISDDKAKTYALLNEHPMVSALTSNLLTNQTQILLAKEAFKPKFGVEVMYAHRRANTMANKSAPDLLSAFVTVDLPWPHYQRQHHDLSAAQHRFSATQSQKDTLLMQMQAKTAALISDRRALLRRIDHYQNRLLPKSTERIQAEERSYQNNRTTLSRVLSTMMEDIDWQLALLRLQTDLNKVNAQLAFFFDGFFYSEPTLPLSLEGER